MRIVLFNYFGDKPNPVYEELSIALRRRGHTVWVGQADTTGGFVWHNGQGEMQQMAGCGEVPGRLNGIPLLSQFVRSIKNVQFMMRMRRHIQSLSPDIVMVNTVTAPWVLTLFTPKNMHFIYDIRQINENVSDRLLSRLKEKKTVSVFTLLASRVYEHTCFCHEEAAKRVLGENWARKSSVVPVGVDTQFLRDDIDHKPCCDEREPIRFIYIGTLSPLRNLGQIMSAAQLLSTTTRRFQIDFVGPDKSHGQYARRIEELGIESVAAIKGPVAYEDVPDLLCQYDVGLAYVPDRPTWHYQPTIKALEYRALGLPILSTDVASHREIVLQGQNGLLVQDTIEGIAEGMRRFVDQIEFLKNSRENALRLRQGMTWDDVARMYESNVFDKLMAS